MPKLIKLGTLRCGIDLAAGCNENSMYIFDGNFKIFEDHWQEKDTTITAERILKNLWQHHSLGLLPENVNADDGGIGHAIIDMIRRGIGEYDDKGWNINRVMNQSAPKTSRLYGNRGAELYFNIKRLAEAGYIILDKDKDALMISQLKSRRFKQSEGQGKLSLESKKEAIAKGRPSPDRADAFCLTFANVSISDFIEHGKEVASSSNQYLSQQELIKLMDKMKFKEYFSRFFNSESNNTVNSKTPSQILRSIYAGK
jgi:phage terminase large subunit